MIKSAASTALALLLIACEAPETVSDSFPENDATDTSNPTLPDESTPDAPNRSDNETGSSNRPLSNRPIPKRDLSRLNDLLRSNPSNLLHVQYLYCTDSHWRKSTAKKAVENSRGTYVSYAEAEQKCDVFAKTLSQCLSQHGFNISPRGLKNDDGYIKFYQEKYKDSFSTNTYYFGNRDRMNVTATCKMEHTCDSNTLLNYGKEAYRKCQVKKEESEGGK